VIGSRRTSPRATIGVASIAALLIVVTAGALATVAAAEDVDGGSHVADASDPRAVLLLVGAVRAQRIRSYTGTEYVCAWTQGSAATSVVQVQHVAGSGTYVSVQPSVAAPGRTVQEPEQVASTSGDPLAVPAVEAGPLDLLRRNFVLSLGPPDGTHAQVQAHRADGTMAAAFWIDTTNGLPLRREVFDNSGRLVRASAFVELHLVSSVVTTTATAAPTVSSPESALTHDDIASLRQQGWIVPAQLPDAMMLYDAREQGTGTKRILHLSYSDGLSTVSVFVQRGRLATKSLAGWAKTKMGGAVYLHDYGLGRRVTWSGHGHVYTVVADAPPAAVAAMVAALPHGERHRGAWARFRHGMSRLGSWLNPFG
jgi:sigma-E factor negative regulatory protein RseB